MNYGTVTLEPGRTYRIIGELGSPTYQVIRNETDIVFGVLTVQPSDQWLDLTENRWMDAANLMRLIDHAAELVRTGVPTIE